MGQRMAFGWGSVRKLICALLIGFPLVAAAGPDDDRIYIPGHAGPEGYNPGIFGRPGIPRHPVMELPPLQSDTLGPSPEEEAEDALQSLASSLRTSLRWHYAHPGSTGNPLNGVARYSPADNQLWQISYSTGTMAGYLRYAFPRPTTVQALVAQVMARHSPMYHGSVNPLPVGPPVNPRAIVESNGFMRSLRQMNEGYAPPPLPPPVAAGGF